MRYNVHPSRAFHSRIAKSLGVLVGAALVATLWLPSVAQAQDIQSVAGSGSMRVASRSRGSGTLVLPTPATGS